MWRRIHNVARITLKKNENFGLYDVQVVVNLRHSKDAGSFKYRILNLNHIIKILLQIIKLIHYLIYLF